MNTQQLTVANGDKDNIRICLSGQWLPNMGFIPHALVRVVPEPGGVTFTLAGSPSQQGHGGRLIRVPPILKCPVLIARGKYLCETGFHYGDPLLACYYPGVIRIRRFPVRAKAVMMADDQVRLSGVWLAESGFLPDTVALTSSEPGRIIIKRHDAVVRSEYTDLVRFARQNKMKIIQFYRKANSKAPAVSISGSCVDKAGFFAGDMLIANYEQDLIVIQKLDFVGLGF
jgi:hypothetical protein